MIGTQTFFPLCKQSKQGFSVPSPARSPHSPHTGGNAVVGRLDFHAVTRDRWDDLERLFDAPGGPKHCWCMVWRAMPKGASRSDSQAKKEALESRVQQGVPIGILGYVDGEPAAWCSVAPRNTFRDLGGAHLPGDAPESVWSVVCFFVPRPLRLQGVARSLLEAAVVHARSNGAKMLEAYPVDLNSPSYRFMGFVSTFKALGFREVGTAGTRRHVMRLPL
ncbi:MAG: GNAT family N-acetyltransferase [Chloroflexi bacterium]|nr:GNAT family N-acetyltransferase [Chloroflexota bacterium]